MDLNSPLHPFAVAVLILTLSAVGLVVRKRLTPHRLPLPPGPKGLPFLGCLLEIDKTEPWLTFERWKMLFGELVSCRLLGRNFIIINSETVAKALLEQPPDRYSCRPMIQTYSLFEIEFNTGRLFGDETLLSHRRIFYQNLFNSIILKCQSSVFEGTRILLGNLLHSPGNHEDHMRTYAASISLSATYGCTVISTDRPFQGLIEEMIKIFVLMTPGRAFLLGRFSLLPSLPSFFTSADLGRLPTLYEELSSKLVGECLSKNVENNSVVAQLLKDETVTAQGRESYERDIKACAMLTLLAGTCTMQSALSTLVMALVLYPEVQDRAQAEIDRVVGRNRLPAFDDRGSLQYIDALLRETLRWGLLVPMTAPHMVEKDVIFEQCLIPRGSIIITNLWGMARDEEYFPNPTAFRPERHLDADGNLLSNDASGLYFGYGRNVCPGWHLADSSTWFAAANMLSMFRFAKVIGPAGYEVDVFPKFTGGIVRRPVPFPCRITPRFEEAVEFLS